MPCSAVRPLLALILVLGALGSGAAGAQAASRVTVVVGAEPGSERAAARLVERLGGEVGHRLAIVHGFSARVPAAALPRLRRAAAVRTVARDARLTLSTDAPVIAPPPAEIPAGAPADAVAHEVITDAAQDAAGAPLDADPVRSGEDTVGAVQDAVADPVAPIVPEPDDGPARARASIELIRDATGATQPGLTGAGVDVALIDSGVIGVAALDGPGKLVRGPDFSEDALDPDRRGLDAFGHGSHMAGVIAGDDGATGYRGIAPGARLVSVKVADADGVTSLVRVLMALDWVRHHRDRDGLRIRAVNLSFGVDARRSYVREPLAYAAEQLWNRGVTVVAAAGNQADGTGRLDLPAADPFLIAVGATDAQGAVADFSSRDAARPPDVVAPGTGVVSLRVPGSTLDSEFPAARIGEGFFRGSGTSQATAVVTGLVALLLQARPELSPDQVKALLRRGATALDADVSAAGAGAVDLQRSLALDTPPVAAQPYAPAVLDLAALWADLRAESSGQAPGVGTGENGWTGRRWSGRRWSGRRWSGRRWSGNDWSADAQ